MPVKRPAKGMISPMQQDKEPFAAILPHEELLPLLRSAKQGDEAARERVVLSNVALVRSIVKRYLGHGHDYDDLYQLGCMGLVKAINNYDEGYGVRFSTYAVPLIMGEIRRFLRDDGAIRVARPVKDLYSRCVSLSQGMYERLGREPTLEELAAELSVSREEIAFAMDAARMPISIHAPVMGDGGRELTVGDSIPVKDNTDGVINRVLIKEMLSTLAGNERQIIVMRYLMEKTQSEVAKTMGISQVQVSRMESRIIKKMRQAAGIPEPLEPEKGRDRRKRME